MTESVDQRVHIIATNPLWYPQRTSSMVMMVFQVYLFHHWWFTLSIATAPVMTAKANYDGLSFPSPRLCRDVIQTKVVYFFHLCYWDPWPQDLDVILYILSNLHKLLKRGGVMKPNESAKNTLCRS